MKFPFSAILGTAAVITVPVLMLRGASLFATQLEAQRAAQRVNLVAAQAQAAIAQGRAAIDLAAARAIDAGTMAVTFDRLAAHPDIARQVAGMPWIVPFLCGVIAALVIALAVVLVVTLWQDKRHAAEESVE